MNQLLTRNIPLISTIILTNIVITNSPVIAALKTEEVNKIAEQIVVNIHGTNKASGVIISKSENTYGVLTTWESVKNEGYYKITTIEGKSYTVIDKIQIKGADLAIIYFKSEEEYSLAKFGNSDEIKSGEIFYLAGYSLSLSDNKTQEYRFYSQNLSNIIEENKSRQGYQLVSSGSGLPGMPGSAILNVNGRLIGIYGKTKVNKDTLQANLLGIPINTFEQLTTSANIDINRPIAKVNLPEPPIEPKLISKTTQINYVPLRNLLAAQRWQEADKITLDLMLEVAENQEEGWFTSESVSKFPCDDLNIIDNLWLKYSGDRFGFKTQEKIYLDTGNELNNYDLITFRDFANNIGWRENDEWLSKDNLMYNKEAPIGHLPAVSSKRLGVYLGILFSSCQL